MSGKKMVQLICPDCGAFVTAFADNAQPIQMRNTAGEVDNFNKEAVDVVCNNCDKRVCMAIITAVSS